MPIDPRVLTFGTTPADAAPGNFLTQVESQFYPGAENSAAALQERIQYPLARQLGFTDKLKEWMDEKKRRMVRGATTPFDEKPAGVLDVAMRFPTSVGDAFWYGDIFDAVELYKAGKAQQRGEATQEQQDLLISKAIHDSSPKTFGYNVTNVALMMPEFMLSFAISGAGVKSAAKGLELAAEKTIVKNAIGKTSQSAISWLSKNLAADVLTGESIKQLGIAGTVKAAAVQAPIRAVLLPDMLLSDMLQRMTPDFNVSEEDTGLLMPHMTKPGDDFWPALSKAYMNTAIEAFSEATGEALGAAVSLGLGKAPFAAAIMNRWAKISPRNRFPRAFNLLQHTGWNGMLQEMAEERVGDVMRRMAGLQDTFIPTFDQLMVEATAFAIPGATMNAARIAADGLPHEAYLKNMEKYSRISGRGKHFIPTAQFDESEKELRGIFEEEDKDPWYKALPVIGKRFTNYRSGTVHDILNRVGSKFLRSEYDKAMDELREKQEKARPGRKVDDSFVDERLKSAMSRLYRIGETKTEAEAEKLQEAYDSGKVKELRDDIWVAADLIKKRARFWTPAESMDDEEFKTIAASSGIITAAKNQADLERGIVGELTPEFIQENVVGDQIKAPLVDFIKDMLGLDDSKEALDIARRIVDLNQKDERFSSGRISFKLSMATMLRGTEEELQAATQYGEGLSELLRPLGKPAQGQKQEYVVAIDSVSFTAADNQTVLLPIGTTAWGMAEDTLHAVLRDSIGSFRLTGDAKEWSDALDRTLPDLIATESQLERPNSQKLTFLRQLESMGKTERGRHERFVKTYMASRMGFDGIAKERAFNRMFNEIAPMDAETGEKIDAWMYAHAGKNVIDTLSFNKQRPAGQPSGVEMIQGMIPGQTGRARELAGLASQNRESELIDRLSHELNNLDMRTDAGRNQVGKTLDEIDESGVLFSLVGLLNSMEKQDIRSFVPARISKDGRLPIQIPYKDDYGRKFAPYVSKDPVSGSWILHDDLMGVTELLPPDFNPAPATPEEEHRSAAVIYNNYHNALVRILENHHQLQKEYFINEHAEELRKVPGEETQYSGLPAEGYERPELPEKESPLFGQLSPEEQAQRRAEIEAKWTPQEAIQRIRSGEVPSATEATLPEEREAPETYVKPSGERHGVEPETRTKEGGSVRKDWEMPFEEVESFEEVTPHEAEEQARMLHEDRLLLEEEFDRNVSRKGDLYPEWFLDERIDPVFEQWRTGQITNEEAARQIVAIIPWETIYGMSSSGMAFSKKEKYNWNVINRLSDRKPKGAPLTDAQIQNVLNAFSEIGVDRYALEWFTRSSLADWRNSTLLKLRQFYKATVGGELTENVVKRRKLLAAREQRKVLARQRGRTMQKRVGDKWLTVPFEDQYSEDAQWSDRTNILPQPRMVFRSRILIPRAGRNAEYTIIGKPNMRYYRYPYSEQGVVDGMTADLENIASRFTGRGKDKLKQRMVKPFGEQTAATEHEQSAAESEDAAIAAKADLISSGIDDYGELEDRVSQMEEDALTIRADMFPDYAARTTGEKTLSPGKRRMLANLKREIRQERRLREIEEREGVFQTKTRTLAGGLPSKMAGKNIPRDALSQQQRRAAQPQPGIGAEGRMTTEEMQDDEASIAQERDFENAKPASEKKALVYPSPSQSYVKRIVSMTGSGGSRVMENRVSRTVFGIEGGQRGVQEDPHGRMVVQFVNMQAGSQDVENAKKNGAGDELYNWWHSNAEKGLFVSTLGVADEPNIGVHGVVTVLDTETDSREADLGYPILRINSALYSGIYPKSGSETGNRYEKLRDIWAALGDAPKESYFTRSDYQVEGEKNHIFRASLPLNSTMLLRAGRLPANQRRIEVLQLARELNDFIRQNRIRSLGVASTDLANNADNVLMHDVLAEVIEAALTMTPRDMTKVANLSIREANREFFEGEDQNVEAAAGRLLDRYGLAETETVKQRTPERGATSAVPEFGVPTRTIMLTGATAGHGFKELGAETEARLLALPRDTKIVVGDEPSGADRAFQDLLKRENFTNVTVHHSGRIRYNAGFHTQETSGGYRAKDATMLGQATEVLGARDLGPSSRQYVAAKPFGAQQPASDQAFSLVTGKFPAGDVRNVFTEKAVVYLGDEWSAGFPELLTDRYVDENEKTLLEGVSQFVDIDQYEDDESKRHWGHAEMMVGQSRLAYDFAVKLSLTPDGAIAARTLFPVHWNTMPVDELKAEKFNRYAIAAEELIVRGVNPETRYFLEGFDQQNLTLNLVSGNRTDQPGRATTKELSFSLASYKNPKAGDLHDETLHQLWLFNNRRDFTPAEHEAYSARYQRFMQTADDGDASYFYQRFSPEERKGLFRDLIAAARRNAHREDQAQERNDDILYSLRSMDEAYDWQAPVLLSGAEGLHSLYLKEQRHARAMQFAFAMETEKWERSIGLREDKARGLKLNDEQKAQARLLLEAVGAKLDYGEAFNPNDPMRSKIPRDRVWNEEENGWDLKGEDVTTVFRDWNAMKPAGAVTAQELYDTAKKKYDKAREEANAYVRSLSNNEWIRWLDNYINHHYISRSRDPNAPRPSRIFAEDVRYSKERRIATYADALIERNFVPMTMNVTALYEMWGAHTYRAAANRMFLSTAILAREVDGEPQVLAVPRKGYTGDQAISPEYLLKSAQQLAEFVGDAVNESQPIDEEIRRLSAKLNVKDYEKFDSPYDSTDYFLVRKGLGSRVMKMALNASQFSDSKWMSALDALNAWTKFLAIAVPFMSFFHPFSLAESLSAASGIRLKEIKGIKVPYNAMLPWNVPGTIKSLKDFNAFLRNSDEGNGYYSKAIEAGLGADLTNPDVPVDRISRDIRKGIARLPAKVLGMDTTWAKERATAFLRTKAHWDQWLWREWQPGMKLMTFYGVKAEIEANFKERGITFDEQKVNEDIAQYVNDAFGGQELDRYAWATPDARRVMHNLFFAFDWTLSAANVAGITQLPGIKQLVQAPTSSIAQHEQLTRYWPAMIGIVLFAIPNMMQALIFAAAGSPDDDDKPFTFMNETGRRTHIDITPLVRKLGWIPVLGYEGGDSGKQRAYLRWGKQAYEIMGWLTKPERTFMGKTSVPIRTAYELGTGTTTSGWDLPFKDTGLFGWFEAEGKFSKGKTAHLLEKILPISIASIVQDRPTSFFAPSSRGISQGRAIAEMTKMLANYADPTAVDKLHGIPDFEQKFEVMVSDIYDACIRNGVDPSEVLERASSTVLGRQYLRFFRALNDNRDGEMQDAAESIVRMHGELKNFHTSMKKRYEAVGRQYPPEYMSEVTEKFRQAFAKFHGEDYGNE